MAITMEQLQHSDEQHDGTSGPDATTIRSRLLRYGAAPAPERKAG